MAALKRAEGAKRGHLNSARSSISSRQETVDSSMQRCGLCSMLSRLVRRAMCVGSRRGSGESYYQELADTTVSIKYTNKYICLHSLTCYDTVAITILVREYMLSISLATRNAKNVLSSMQFCTRSTYSE